MEFLARRRVDLSRHLEMLESQIALLKASSGTLIGLSTQIRGELYAVENQAKHTSPFFYMWWEKLLAFFNSAKVIPPPVLTGILPDPLARGVAVGDTAGGQLIELIGSFLLTATSVTVGGAAATIVKDEFGRVFAVAPAKAPGTYDVTITTLGGSDTLLNVYQAWSPLQLAGAWVYDSRFGVTQAGALASQWNDRAGSGINPAQAPPLQPNYDAKDFASFYNIAPGMWGVGTSGPGAIGSLLDAAHQALPVGKTYFWVGKIPVSEVRATAGTQGNVACSVVGDDAVGGWSGNAGYGGQQGDVVGGQISMINWNDTVGGFQRMTWDGQINDGLPHCVTITHAQPLPSPAEAYLDNTRILTGRIAPQLAGVPIVAQPTPFLSDYHGAALNWNALFGGKSQPGAGDDYMFGDMSALVILPSVISAPNRDLLFEWGHNTFTFQFYTWELRTAVAPETPNDGVGLVFFNSKLYRICGWNGLAHKKVYSSADGGATWVVQPDFAGQAGHAMPVITHVDGSGKKWIYVIGGDPVTLTGEIWRTDNPEDGAAWQLVTATSPTLGRAYYMGQSVGGSLYIVGGQSDANLAASADSNVYKSTDEGFTWTQIANAPFSGRCFGAFGVLPNGDGIIACGGRLDANPLLAVYFNGVWTIHPATDAWTMRLADGHTQFPPRRYTNGFTLQGFFWFGDGFGGFGTPAPNPADNILDLQFTLDGTTWFPYHYPRWAQTHADSWAVDTVNQIAYHGFGISGNSDFWRFRPNPT
jgi:hypothetical protein